MSENESAGIQNVEPDQAAIAENKQIRSEKKPRQITGARKLFLTGTLGIGVIVAACSGGGNDYHPVTKEPTVPTGVNVVRATETTIPTQTASVEGNKIAQPAKTPEATSTPEVQTKKHIEVYADPSIPQNVKNRITGKTVEETITSLKTVTDQLPDLGGNRKMKIVPGQILSVDPEDPTQVLLGIDLDPQILSFYAVHEYEHVVGTQTYSGDTKTLEDRRKYMTQDEIDEENKLAEDALSGSGGRQFPVLSKMFTPAKAHVNPLTGNVNYGREDLLDWKGQYADNIWLQTGTEHYTGFTQGKNIENITDASEAVPVTFGLLVPETFKVIDSIAQASDTNAVMPYKDLPDFLQKNEQLINDQILNNPDISAEERAITQKSFELLKAQQNLFTWENISSYPDLYGKYDAGWKSALKSYLQLAFEEKYMEKDPEVTSLVSKDKIENYNSALNSKFSMADTEELAQFHATVVLFKIPGTSIEPYLSYQQGIANGTVVKLQ